jgi:hypothetical protein
VGIDLASIIKDRGIEFHYSEYGLGGGVSIHGNRPARTAYEAAKTPFYGVWGAYQKRTDPWRNPQVRRRVQQVSPRTHGIQSTGWDGCLRRLCLHGSPKYGRGAGARPWQVAYWTQQCGYTLATCAAMLNAIGVHRHTKTCLKF